MKRLKGGKGAPPMGEVKSGMGGKRGWPMPDQQVRKGSAGNRGKKRGGKAK